MATAVLDSILAKQSIFEPAGTPDVTLLCALPDGTTADLTVGGACKVSDLGSIIAQKGVRSRRSNTRHSIYAFIVFRLSPQ